MPPHACRQKESTIRANDGITRWLEQSVAVRAGKSPAEGVTLYMMSPNVSATQMSRPKSAGRLSRRCRASYARSTFPWSLSHKSRWPLFLKWTAAITALDVYAAGVYVPRGAVR